MSDLRRRSETQPAQPRVQQGSDHPWTPAEQGIDPSEAAAFRRRLDYQGSAELIPTAGPDAPADQGPAIKAVWEPAPPEAAGHVSRRRDRRGAGGASGPARGRGRRQRRRSLIIGGVAVVALGVTGYSEMTGSGPAFSKGAATTVLPAVSSSADDGQAANASLGSGISVTNLPSHSPTPSRSSSASASASASTSASPKQSTPAGAGAGAGVAGGESPPAGQPSASAADSPTTGSGGGGGGSGGGGTGGSGGGVTPTPTPSPTQTHRSCFLFFCS